jgi:hypothetical protein
MKYIAYAVILLVTAGCTGGPCNPPPILYPFILPIGLEEAIRDALRRPRASSSKSQGALSTPITPVTAPVLWGDSLEHPFVLEGTMTEGDLRSQEAYFYWISHGYNLPGVPTKYLFYSSPETGRKIDAVFYRAYDSNKEICFYFEVTHVVLKEMVPVQPPLPTPASATPPSSGLVAPPPGAAHR